MHRHVIVLAIVAFEEDHEGNSCKELQEFYEVQLFGLSGRHGIVEVALLGEAVESHDETLFEEGKSTSYANEVYRIRRRQVVLASIVVITVQALHDRLIPLVKVIHLVSVKMLVSESLCLSLLLEFMHDVVLEDLIDGLE